MIDTLPLTPYRSPSTPEQEVASHPSLLTPDYSPTPLELLNLYLSDGKSKGDATNELYHKFNQELTWDALLNEGYQKDLAPLLYHIITKTSLLTPNSSSAAPVSSPLTPHRDHVSDEITNKLKDLYNQSLAKNMVQFSELEKILNVFEKEGIDVIQLKGAWIAKNYYPDPVLRPMNDLDLLIRPEDMKRAENSIEKMGYVLFKYSKTKEHYHHTYIKNHSVSPVVAELHFDIRAKSDFIHSNVFDIWKNSVTIGSRYNHILRQPNEYLLLHILWHNYYDILKHNVRFIGFCDIAFIVKKLGSKMDWSLLEKKMEEWKIQNHSYFCFNFIEQVFNLKLNELMINRIKPSRVDVKLYDLVFLIYKKRTQPGRAINYINLIILNLISLRSIKDRMLYFIKYNVRNPMSINDRIKLKYDLRSGKSTYLVYLIYPYHFLTLFVKVIKGSCSLISETYTEARIKANKPKKVK